MENYVDVIIALIRSNKRDKDIKEILDTYHKSDIADTIPLLNEKERNKLMFILGKEDFSEVLTYLDNVDEFFENVSYENAADLVELMDADDAVDALQELDEEDRENILSLMEEEARSEAELILSFEEDEIGSKMTTNYITISKTDTIKKAMRSLISQAEENDNISKLVVVDENNKFCGIVDLKDLICARKEHELIDLIVDNYPSIYAKTKIEDCINEIRDYEEDMIPIINEKDEVLGVITSNDIIEVVDEELSEDFHKFASISEDNDISEGVFVSMKKRIPWLTLLVFLGLTVSILISSFEAVIETLPVMVFFQSMILGMAGNSGTQSLAVTVRALSDDVSSKDKFKLIFRELRVGFMNGFILGIISFVVCLIYLGISRTIIHGEEFIFIDVLIASSIVGLSLLASMTLSSLIGTTIPIIFKKIHIDPAVASGPLITTFNDIIAVICYYGLTILLFASYVG